MAARTRVGLGGPAAAYRPFVARVVVAGPGMLFLVDVYLRGPLVTTPTYEPAMTLAHGSVSDARLIRPLATDVVLAHD